MTIIILISSIFLFIFLIELLNPLLPKWACDRFSWHISPKEINFDGENYYGYCPRCGKKLTKNLQGGWY